MKAVQPPSLIIDADNDIRVRNYLPAFKIQGQGSLHSSIRGDAEAEEKRDGIFVVSPFSGFVS